MNHTVILYFGYKFAEINETNNGGCVGPRGFFSAYDPIYYKRLNPYYAEGELDETYRKINWRTYVRRIISFHQKCVVPNKDEGNQKGWKGGGLRRVRGGGEGEGRISFEVEVRSP